MSGFSVVPADLIAARGQLADACDRAADALRQARARADTLFAGGWSGPAAAACEQAWEQWRAGAARSCDALDRIAAGVQRCAADYADAEARAAAALRAAS